MNAFLIRRSAQLFAWLALSAILSLLPLGAQTPEKKSPDTLCVMTYNLRFANSNPGEVWSSRRPMMREMLSQISPDVIGTQEGLYGQIKDLAGDMPAYDWIGLGREGGSRGEFMAVFYRKERLEPLAYDHFWLSDTPDVIGSTTWGNSVRRMVTWIKFSDRRTKQEFYLVNTHFDHQVQPAREKSAELVRKRIQQLDPKLPLVLTGDFNAAADKNKAYKILTEGDFLKDTWHTARERKNDGIGTFNSFDAIKPGGARIDWILTRGAVVAQKIEIVTFSREGRFPSDHFPVVAWLQVGEAR